MATALRCVRSTATTMHGGVTLAVAVAVTEAIPLAVSFASAHAPLPAPLLRAATSSSLHLMTARVCGGTAGVWGGTAGRRATRVGCSRCAGRRRRSRDKRLCISFQAEFLGIYIEAECFLGRRLCAAL